MTPKTLTASYRSDTVLVTHGESGRSGVGRTRNVVAPTSLAGQFEQPYGPMGPPTLFTIPVLRYMKLFRRPRESGGLGASERTREPWVPASAGTTRQTHQQLAMVSVVHGEWAGKNPRATFKTPAPPAPRGGI
jgi:hypothetical protein